jgi:nitrous oxidase accessory protein NosD
VSTRGSDGGAGTREAPLRTIGRAVALASPGEVIRVLPGVYPEELVLESRGRGAAAITLRGEGSPRPTLVPSTRTRSTVLRVRGRWKLENLHVDVGGARMFAVTFDSGASQSVLSDSVLEDGTSSAGVLVEGGKDITIQRNSIHHFIRSGDDSHGVVVVGPSRNVIIRDNDIHHNSGDSVQCQSGAGPAEVLLIEGNTLHDEGENGVDIKWCRYVTVRGNRLFGFPNTAIRPAGSSAGEAVVLHEAARDILIQGNAISRAGRGVSVVGGGTFPENVWVEGNHFREIRNFPAGNGQGIRVARARNVRVEGNTLEATASYGLMLAADGGEVSGLVVRNNILRGGSQPLLLRLGHERFRPGFLLEGNHYAPGGVLKADGVGEKLSGEHGPYLEDFPGEQLTLSSSEKLELWRQVLGVDMGSGLLE